MATRGKELLDSAKWNHRSDTSSDFLNDSNEQDADATKTKRRGGDKDVWDIDGEEERDDDASDTIRYRKACSSFNAGLIWKTAAAGLEIPFLFHLKTICRIFLLPMRQSSVKASTNTRTRKALVFLWTGTDDDCQPIVYDRTSMCMCCQSDWCHRYCRGRVHDCPISANRHYTSDTVRFLSAPSPSSFILRLANNISFHFFFIFFARCAAASFPQLTLGGRHRSVFGHRLARPAGEREKSMRKELLVDVVTYNTH